MEIGKANNRLQSSIEYLSTYGWAILILAVVIAALAVLGFFSPQSAAGTTCVINQGFTCTQPYLSSNGILSFTLVQNKYQDVNVTGVGCSSNSSNSHITAPYNPPSNQINMHQATSHVFNVQCYSNTGNFVGAVGTPFAGDIYVNYVDDVAGFSYSATATVYAKITFGTFT